MPRPRRHCGWFLWVDDLQYAPKARTWYHDKKAAGESLNLCRVYLSGRKARRHFEQFCALGLDCTLMRQGRGFKQWRSEDRR